MYIFKIQSCHLALFQENKAYRHNDIDCLFHDLCTICIILVQSTKRDYFSSELFSLSDFSLRCNADLSIPTNSAVLDIFPENLST